MATRFELDPKAALFTAPTTMPALVRTTAGELGLAFDGSADEFAAWSFTAPTGLTGTLYVDLYLATTGTTGNTLWAVYIQAVTPADALDILTANSIDTVNLSAATAVPVVAGTLFKVTITLTNADSMAAGDRVRLLVGRVASGDTNTTDVVLLGGAFRDSA